MTVYSCGFINSCGTLFVVINSIFKVVNELRSRFFLLVHFMLILLASGQSISSDIKTTLIIAGTGDSQLLLRTLSAKFIALGSHSNLIIKIPESVGSSGGLRALNKNKISLARTARALNKKEEQSGLLQHLFAQSPIVFVVHPSVSGIDSLTLQQIIGIYTRKHLNWDELGGPNKPIYPIQREQGDSSRRVLGYHISNFPRKSSSKIYYTTLEAALALADHKFSFGYLPLNVAEAYNLRVLSYNEVQPSEKNVLNGNYKLVAPFYLVSKGEPSGIEKKFIRFLRSKAAKDVIRKYGAIPAP